MTSKNLKRFWDKELLYHISIVLDKRKYQLDFFSYFFTKTYVVGRQGAYNEKPQHVFSWDNKKNINTLWLIEATYLELWLRFKQK